MDIFGKKKNRSLVESILNRDQTIEQLESKVKQLSKPYDEYKNRPRVFKVYPYTGKAFEIRARYFNHDNTGYYFYDTETTVSLNNYSISRGALVAHVSNREVFRVEEQPE